MGQRHSTAVNLKKGDVAKPTQYLTERKKTVSRDDVETYQYEQHIHMIIPYEVVKEKNAVASGDYYDHYYLPKSLRDLINNLLSSLASAKIDWDKSGKLEQSDKSEANSRFLKKEKTLPPEGSVGRETADVTSFLIS